MIIRKYPEQFINEIPKTDLHVHLDGSLRIKTLIELAKKYKVKLPSYTESGLRKLVFKDRYKNLTAYLKGFSYTVAVMQSPEAIERIAYEFAVDSINEGIKYVEVRFAPHLHINLNLTFEDVMNAVNNGLKKAQIEFNNSEPVKSGTMPPFYYGIILCALRMFTPEMSYYYKQLFKVHHYTKPSHLYSVASLELAKAADNLIYKKQIPIVGFDLAGKEAGFPAEHHKMAYDHCQHHFIRKTVHAGEAYGAESIFQAITFLHANRIGHGYHLFDTKKITNVKIKNKRKYIQNLVNFIADRRITIEVCLTSNIQTNSELKHIKNHAFKKMLASGISVTLCSDNRLVSNTTVTKEIKLALETFKIPPNKLKNIIIYGFKRSFFWGSYNKKRSYCRTVIDYYEKLEKKYKIK